MLEKILEGIKLVFDHMLEALKAHGVEKIEAAGKSFDPSMHQAMMQRSEEDKEDNIVLEEFQSGYLYNGQVLRPAKVIVNKLPEKQQPAEEDLNNEQE